jgi:NAD-dependent DNA ligase
MPDKFYTLKNDDSLDDHGQPRNRQWGGERLANRSMDELLGLCKGLVADGVLSDEETTCLTGWLKANRQVVNLWPANILAARIEKILEDRIVDQEERKELFALLQDIVGQGTLEGVAAHLSSKLPMTKPAPPVFFTNQRFCFTGRFFFGPRAKCEQEVQSRGGIVQSNVTLQTNYLVIGILASTDWIHSTHGRKIEHAVELERKGNPIALISEHHWMDHLL